jgi:sugar/nucleoside kinase (ribokinase family)
MRYDYAAMGFYTFDCLGWPVTGIPPNGDTYFIEDLTLAVSGAAGTAVIAGAKLGLNCLAIGGYGQDMMGDWAVERIAGFGIDTTALQRIPGVPTSSSIVLTRPDGSRPALHLKGATGAFTIDEADFDRITDARVFHLGGVGLMDAMDGPRNAALIRHAKQRGCITTVDVFAGSPADLPDVEAVLPWTDYFIPSIEEARALSGLEDLDAVSEFFHSRGVTCCVITLGADGAFYHHRDGTRFLVPAYDIDVVCTCGCGDVFNAGFAVGVLNGMSPLESVRLASAASGLNATGLGSQAGIVSLGETLAFMRQRPVRASGSLTLSA